METNLVYFSLLPFKMMPNTDGLILPLTLHVKLLFGCNNKYINICVYEKADFSPKVSFCLMYFGLINNLGIFLFCFVFWVFYFWGSFLFVFGFGFMYVFTSLIVLKYEILDLMYCFKEKWWCVFSVYLEESSFSLICLIGR